jgi:hypothetical protein
LSGMLKVDRSPCRMLNSTPSPHSAVSETADPAKLSKAIQKRLICLILMLTVRRL